MIDSVFHSYQFQIHNFLNGFLKINLIPQKTCPWHVKLCMYQLKSSPLIGFCSFYPTVHWVERRAGRVQYFMHFALCALALVVRCVARRIWLRL